MFRVPINIINFMTKSDGTAYIRDESELHCEWQYKNQITCLKLDFETVWLNKIFYKSHREDMD